MHTVLPCASTLLRRKKPKGMSLRQVRAVITSKYEESLSAALICRYAKQGLVNTSPMKMGPAGHISTMAYKLVCQAYSSLVPINQMNACTGNNSRTMLIPMIAETLNIGTVRNVYLMFCKKLFSIDGRQQKCHNRIRVCKKLLS